MLPMIKSYSELCCLRTFVDRFDYLRLDGNIGDPTFGGRRYLNQLLYNSQEWKRVKQQVIIRDNGLDLGIEDRPIFHGILVHHINPITVEDILKRSPCVFDLENLITTCHQTHNAIHYGDESLLCLDLVNRRPNDTCPWR